MVWGSKALSEGLRNITGYFADKGLPVPAIDVFDSGESLLLDSKKKDIVFLDIEMPGLDGISTGRKPLKTDLKPLIKH